LDLKEYLLTSPKSDLMMTQKLKLSMLLLGLSSSASSALGAIPMAQRRHLASSVVSMSSSVSGGAAFPSIKVYYGNFPFWRAECVRMALHCGGVPFEDVRDKSWAELRESGVATFGALPVMEVDGKILSQTQAMATFAGKLAGLYPLDDDWLAAKCDEAINGCTDVTNTLGPSMRIQDADEKVAARMALCAEDGRLTMHLNGLNALLEQNNKSSDGGAFAVG
jgi:hypothetical protein